MTPEQRRSWRRRVFAEPELTAAQKVVLLALETFADYHEGTNARPGVETLALMCQIDERTARFALKAGRRLNLIEQTGRANPKRGLAAVYRLLPQAVSTGSHDPLEVHSTGSSDPLENGFNRIKSSLLPDQNVVSTGSLDPPTSSRPTQDQGSELPKAGTSPEESVGDSLSQPNYVPSNGKRPRCGRHAHITADADVPRCPDCRDARLADEAQMNDAARRERDRRAAEYARIQRCPDCRGTRWLLDDNDDAFPCEHPKLSTGVAS